MKSTEEILKEVCHYHFAKNGHKTYEETAVIHVIDLVRKDEQEVAYEIYEEKIYNLTEKGVKLEQELKEANAMIATQRMPFGEGKPFTVAYMRELEKMLQQEQITYDRMLELMSEKARDFFTPHPQGSVSEEEIKNTKRSDLWNEIYKEVSKLPRASVDGDAVDHPSLTTTIEDIFIRNLSLPQVSQISKEKVQQIKEALYIAYNSADSFNGYLKDEDKVILKEAIEAAEEISRLEGEDKWISVDERLPECNHIGEANNSSNKVLVLTNTGMNVAWYKVKTSDFIDPLFPERKKGWGTFENTFFIGEVTHWMSLPESPKPLK